ncbi:hypothetical protein ACOSP7_001899 [Xanthoceras sorbifolium]
MECCPPLKHWQWRILGGSLFFRCRVQKDSGRVWIKLPTTPTHAPFSRQITCTCQKIMTSLRKTFSSAVSLLYPEIPFSSSLELKMSEL